MTIKLREMDGGTIDITPEAFQSFKSGFRGPVLTPDDAAYEESRRIWNAMIDRHPGLIARCTGTADVVQAVRFANQHRLLVSVRGGGHNIAGLAVCEGGFMIDLSLLRGVWVDPARRTARAQAGCTLGDVDRETQLHGLAAVLGFVSATGIAGLTVGGGFGYLTRRHGWTCDNLVSMEVVTADAAVLRVSADENEDLFWALRGGGGNFGIVTSFEYHLFPVGPEILGGAIAWRGEDAKMVLDAYREFSAAAPRELTSVAVLRIAPPAPWLPKEIHGKPIAAVFVCHSGTVGGGEALLAPLRKCGQSGGRHRHAAALHADAEPARRDAAQGATLLLEVALPAGHRPRHGLDLAVDHAGRIPSPHSAILLFQIQGALGELARRPLAGRQPRRGVRAQHRRLLGEARRRRR